MPRDLSTGNSASANAARAMTQDAFCFRESGLPLERSLAVCAARDDNVFSPLLNLHHLGLFALEVFVDLFYGLIRQLLDVDLDVVQPVFGQLAGSF